MHVYTGSIQKLIGLWSALERLLFNNCLKVTAGKTLRFLAFECHHCCKIAIIIVQLR